MNRSGPYLLSIALLLLGVSCAPEKRLDAHILLASTPPALQARLGEPKQDREEIEGHIGFMQWEDIEGVKVFAAIKNGKVVYVTYNFAAMESFDEAEAFNTIGIDPPKNEPKHIKKSKAKRWQPFEKYDRLTVNPDTKLISIGAHPYIDLPAEQDPAQESAPTQ